MDAIEAKFTRIALEKRRMGEMKCPKCGKVVNWEEDAFLDDVYKGIEKWEIECSGCHYYWVFNKEEE